MRGNCDSLKDIEKSLFLVLEYISFIHVDNIDIYSNDTFTNGIMIYGHEHIPYIKIENV